MIRWDDSAAPAAVTPPGSRPTTAPAAPAPPSMSAAAEATAVVTAASEEEEVATETVTEAAEATPPMRLAPAEGPIRYGQQPAAAEEEGAAQAEAEGADQHNAEKAEAGEEGEGGEGGDGDGDDGDEFADSATGAIDWVSASNVAAAKRRSEARVAAAAAFFSNVLSGVKATKTLAEAKAEAALEAAEAEAEAAEAAGAAKAAAAAEEEAEDAEDAEDAEEAEEAEEAAEEAAAEARAKAREEAKAREAERIRAADRRRFGHSPEGERYWDQKSERLSKRESMRQDPSQLDVFLRSAGLQMLPRGDKVVARLIASSTACRPGSAVAPKGGGSGGGAQMDKDAEALDALLRMRATHSHHGRPATAAGTSPRRPPGSPRPASSSPRSPRGAISHPSSPRSAGGGHSRGGSAGGGGWSRRPGSRPASPPSSAARLRSPEPVHQLPAELSLLLVGHVAADDAFNPPEPGRRGLFPGTGNVPSGRGLRMATPRFYVQ